MLGTAPLEQLDDALVVLQDPSRLPLTISLAQASEDGPFYTLLSDFPSQNSEMAVYWPGEPSLPFSLVVKTLKEVQREWKTHEVEHLQFLPFFSHTPVYVLLPYARGYGASSCQGRLFDR